MMSFWPRFSRTSFAHLSLALLASCFLWLMPPRAHAQAADDALSQQEVDELRDAAFVPLDRLRVFQQILDDRTRMLNDVVTKRRGHTDYAGEVHDLLIQFGGITDELNDNLDEYSKHHRDVRKILPKLLAAADRWTVALQSPAESEEYAVVRRIAVDNVKDTRDLVQAMQTELETYFKAHPEAAKQEKSRDANPHAVENPQ